MELKRFRAMSTDILLAAEASEDEAAIAFDAAMELIQRYERQFTRFSEDSELARLNRSGGIWFQATPEMVTLVTLAKQYHQLSNGLYDPTILPSLERIGYDQSIDQIRAMSNLSMGSWDVLDKNRPAGMRDVLIDQENERVFLPKGVRIDLGGIAKGWIAEQAANAMAETTQACLVDAGGDMYMIGIPEGEDQWRIDLEDPRDPAYSLVELCVDEGALATSSVMKRVWYQGEQQRHHLIDPRTGVPANTDLASVTVWAPYASMAEVYAKVLLLADPFEAESISLAAPEIKYIAVTQRGEIYGTMSFTELNDELEQKTKTPVA